MSSSPQPGRNAYNSAVGRGRVANQRIQHALEVLAESPGPETRAVLITKIALALIENESALTELEQIGRQAKQKITTD